MFLSSNLHEKYDKVAGESISSRRTARFIQELALPPSVWLCVCDRNDIACCEAELFRQRCFIVVQRLDIEQDGLTTLAVLSCRRAGEL